MDFADVVRDWTNAAQKQRADCKDEYKTKNAIIEPFIHNVLGFNVFDLKEVVPEHACRFGAKDAYKVDYAVFLDGKLVMIIECKGADEPLDRDDTYVGQLKKYYAACETKGLIGVLTNGLQLQFFADTKVPQQMHTEPFLVVDAFKLSDPDIEWLESFTKLKFKSESLGEVIKKVQLPKETETRLKQQLESPDDHFVRLIMRGLEDDVGRLGKTKVEEYRPYVKTAICNYLDAYVAQRLPTTGTRAAMATASAVTSAVNLSGASAVALGSDQDDIEVEAVEEQLAYRDGAASVITPSQFSETDQRASSSPQVRKVRGIDLVNDMRSGMSLADIAAKYSIKMEKPQGFFQQLVSKGVIKAEELPRIGG
ncbi:MAG: hypothetical protein FJ118_12995 [Deltaproteobacteria bacterium]|nr:hypothetical protein [Deltaproteobacteria bacterium]